MPWWLLLIHYYYCHYFHYFHADGHYDDIDIIDDDYLLYYADAFDWLFSLISLMIFSLTLLFSTLSWFADFLILMPLLIAFLSPPFLSLMAAICRWCCWFSLFRLFHDAAFISLLISSWFYSSMLIDAVDECRYRWCWCHFRRFSLIVFSMIAYYYISFRYFWCPMLMMPCWCCATHLILLMLSALFTIRAAISVCLLTLMPLRFFRRGALLWLIFSPLIFAFADTDYFSLCFRCFFFLMAFAFHFALSLLFFDISPWWCRWCWFLSFSRHFHFAMFIYCWCWCLLIFSLRFQILLSLIFISSLLSQ